jgi:hypothetical protein
MEKKSGITAAIVRVLLHTGSSSIIIPAALQSSRKKPRRTVELGFRLCTFFEYSEPTGYTIHTTLCPNGGEKNKIKGRGKHKWLARFFDRT